MVGADEHGRGWRRRGGSPHRSRAPRQAPRACWPLPLMACMGPRPAPRMRIAGPFGCAPMRHLPLAPQPPMQGPLPPVSTSSHLAQPVVLLDQQLQLFIGALRAAGAIRARPPLSYYPAITLAGEGNSPPRLTLRSPNGPRLLAGGSHTAQKAPAQSTSVVARRRTERPRDDRQADDRGGSARPHLCAGRASDEAPAADPLSMAQVATPDAG